MPKLVMAALQNNRQSALKIDERKIRLESRVAPKVRRVFRNMINDAESLYKTTANLPVQELAQNYYPEFLKEVRDAMRIGIREFGFDLRENIEEKTDLFFDAEYKRYLFSVEVKETINISDANIDENLEQINSNFFRESTFFVANQSENQTNFITETNAKEMLEAVEQEELNFARNIQEQSQNITNLSNQEAVAVGSARRRIRRQIESATRQLAESNANRESIIARNIKTNLLAKTQSRSDLIASQNIGLAESWSRQTEAQLINDANLTTAAGAPIDISKEWVAILDSNTRPSHASADGQIVNVNDNFIVGGEALKYPRDPNGTAGNIINCRCVSNNQVRILEPQKGFKAVSDINLKPTATMARNAKRGLEWREEYGRGGTEVGVARARDISNRKNLSPDTVGRMVSYFARHANNRSEHYDFEDGEPTAWRIAWELWGGDEGKTWADKKWAQIEKERGK